MPRDSSEQRSAPPSPPCCTVLASLSYTARLRPQPDSKVTRNLGRTSLCRAIGAGCSAWLCDTESLAQVAEIAEARSDFVSASAALRELLEGGLPVRGAAAERTIESATASSLRVCLRTQIPLELSAALQQPSAAVAALFRQAAAARAQRQQHRAEELTEAAQRQMHKVRQSLLFSFCVR